MVIIECNLKRGGKRRLLFEENISWRDFCIGSENVFIGTTDSVNTSVSLASSMRSARETEAWIEREVALCFLERKIIQLYELSGKYR